MLSFAMTETLRGKEKHIYSIVVLGWLHGTARMDSDASQTDR